ncbi:MAG TPA: hypothetical protein PKK61_03280, partial [Defluviitaleaceae bacterium]|nr:hypothetical protein [Defluviitaleaceae bacterium]
KASEGMEGIEDSLGGVGPVDLGTASSGELDIDTPKFEGKLANLKSILEDFYTNWGAKDLFKGFREGLDLINFDNIKNNLVTTFSGLGEIANTLLLGLQPIFQSAGEAFGASLKYGIAIAGNFFEPITLGWANFVTNMKAPIQAWIMETSQTISNGFGNLTSAFETIGQSWLNSIEKYKPMIAQASEGMLTNISNTFMLIGTVISDTFEAITGKLKEFVEENKGDIQDFTDSIVQIFTDAWNFVNKIWSDVLKSIKKFWNNWGKGIVDGVMDFVNDIKKWFLYLWNDLIKPIWDTMLKWLTKIWNENLKEIVDELLGFVGRVGDLIVKLWNGVLQPLIDKLLKVLVPSFQNAFKFVLDVVGNVVNSISGIINGLLKMLNGIIDFVVGVFTGDWKRAWEGVSKVFEGIVKGLETIFKAPLNFIISGINTFIRGINNIKIPDWVPGVGGKGFNIKEIPHLAKGGITNGPMMAVIGDNPGGREVVSPLDDLLGMIQAVVKNSNESGPINLNLTLKIGEDTITEKLISNINRQNRISGKTVIQV